MGYYSISEMHMTIRKPGTPGRDGQWHQRTVYLCHNVQDSAPRPFVCFVIAAHVPRCPCTVCCMLT